MAVPENDPWPQLIRKGEQARRFLAHQLPKLPGVSQNQVTLRLLVEVTVTTEGPPNDLLDMLLEDLEDQLNERFPELVVDTFIQRPPEDPDPA